MSALPQAALRWARELLGAEPDEGGRYRLEILHERLAPSPFHRTRVYRVELAVWDLAQVAHLSRSGPLRYPEDPLGVGESASEPPPREGPPPRAWRQARAAGRMRYPEARVGCRSWRLVRGDLWVWLERREPDGFLELDLDPLDAARLGYRAPFLLRGSTQRAALSRPSAVVRARAALPDLPEDAHLVYSRLARRTTGKRQERVWHLRWLVERGPLRGRVRALVNASTGAIAELRQALYSAAADPWSERETAIVAEAEMGRQARARLGRTSVIGVAVEAVTDEEPARPCFVAVVTDARARRWRATWTEGVVAFRRLEGEAEGEAQAG
ncbi:MAG: hypothetical protein AB7N76_05795 [Planctomycetota bacterium]